MNDLGIRTVIVPVDGTARGERAFPVAAFLARALDVDVQILAVATSPEHGRRLEPVLAHAQERLVGHIGSGRVAFDFWTAERIVAAAEPADAVACLATDWGPGRSIGRQVVFASTGPVVLVGPDARMAEGVHHEVLSVAMSSVGDRADACGSIAERWAIELGLDHVRLDGPAAADDVVERSKAATVSFVAWAVPTGWMRHLGRRARLASTVIRRSGAPVLAVPSRLGV